MNDLPTIEQRNKRRLAKIHKLKRENRVLASRRNSLMDKKIAQAFLPDQISGYSIFVYSNHLCYLSEQIGKNSAKIMRLRTMIKQSGG